jgi:glycosyltransferase involved in cell wall biosynthesis
MKSVVKNIGVIGLKGLPAFGGAATVGQHIVESLKEEYNFTVYAISTHTNSPGFHDGYRQIVFKKFFIRKLNIFYYYMASAFHALFLGKYDVIHLHHIDGAFIVPLLKLRFRVVATSHGLTYEQDKWGPVMKRFFRFNEKIFLRYSDCITSVSRPLVIYYKNKTKKPVIFIPNGISLDHVDFPQVSLSRYILFSAGRIIAIKGCHHLLTALHKLQYKGKVVIIGDLNQVASYKREIQKLSKDLDVVFIDLIKDKPLLLSYVKNALLFVFPSLLEAMSMMLLEAASVRTPIICSNIPANSSLFDESEVNFFEADSTDDLAMKIEWALNNQAIVRGKAELAYRKLIGNYLWKDITKQYDGVYQGQY